MNDRREFVSTEFALTQGEDTRVLTGLAVPYGVPSDAREIDGAVGRFVFEPGSLARSIRERGSKVRLLTEHDTGRLPIGRAVDFDDSPEGLRISFEFAETTAAEDALRLVRDGYVSGLSVGVDVKRRTVADRFVRITEAALREVSLVNEPALVGAGFSGDAGGDGHANGLDVTRARLRLRLVEKGFIHG